MQNLKVLMLLTGIAACLIRLGHFFYVYYELGRALHATGIYSP